MLSSVVFRVVLAALFGLFSWSLNAQNCSVADMKGDFATQPQGALTVGPFAGPFAATGVIHFDGVGRFDGVATSSFNGGVIFPFDAVGSYEVTKDCVVTVFEETLRIAFEGYLTRNKTEVFLFQPQDSAITTNILRRIQIPKCGNETLNNTWITQAAGNNIITAARFAHAGRLKFDGKGGLSGTLGSSVGGAIVRSTFNGAYAMSGDCTFKFNWKDQNGIQSFFYGTMFGDGTQFVFISSEDGVVITGQAKRGIDE